MRTTPVCSLVRNTKEKGNFFLCREAKFTAALRLFALHRDHTSRPPLGISQTYHLRKESKGTNASAMLCQTVSGTKPTQSSCLTCTDAESLINFLHKPSWESKHTPKKMRALK